ncbi:protein kinase domain protein [Ichthyophthirius multifiliis]|uniref:Protein kinase domain protein n=1 Tax=Ichthyophthirius multifiliis TaxID=5932 RepID=G0QTH7_ICHMU|nr:protein kinase domain protein [Ichthyophthirius multifiliis]EGR31480.1 protein kinase domain protein [Ichthyophthirius multifiliis]|eukprot:XP_004034966.1 protein kinase domain protein [Ichthyophthirius multifiliis]
MQKQTGDYVYDTSRQSLLGEGSFGRVYRGKNIKTGELVAVKQMDTAMFKDKYMKECLENEVNIMKQLKSDYIVKLYHTESDQSKTLIVLELCNNGDLREYISNKGGTLDEKQSIEILNQLMNGFREMVSHGFIHRDIKPENALVKNDCFKISDFGFATKADIQGRQLIKECVGTPLYMAPQLLENTPYTAKSDIWSIGMMFYEMLFGKTQKIKLIIQYIYIQSPWPARDVQSYLRNMKSFPLKFPYDKQIGQNTRDFIVKCLTLNEKDRINWDDIFSHPILQLQTGQQTKPAVQLDQKAQLIIRSMQYMVQNKNVNLDEIFSRFDQNKGGSLDLFEFHQLLSSIDPRITYYESEHVFKTLDQTKDGQISKKEFEDVFKFWDFADTQDKVSSVIVDLQEIIKNNNLDLKLIFQNFDKDAGGSLNFQEFVSLIKIVAPKMKQYEIKPIFDKFDKNGDGNVSYEEFYHILNYGNSKDSQFKPDQEKARKLINELKRIITTNNLNLKQIFNNFDKSKDGNLNLEEFTKLVLVIDKKLPQNEIKNIFDLFNVDGGNEITFTEFQKTLI